MKFRLHCWVLLLTSLMCGCSTVHAEDRFNFDQTPGHLGKQVVPAHYALGLDLDPAADQFGGEVDIALRVRQSVKSIEIHAFELTAKHAKLIGADASREPRMLRVAVQPESQTWLLEPVDGLSIEPGSYRLQIGYAGKVNVAGEGLYVAPYELNGIKHRMLATQLEAIHARRLFPAFDEPSFRAVFEITVRAPENFEVVSNMPRISRGVEDHVAVHRFAPTLAMPTYLVSVSVGQFDMLDGEAAGIPLRILGAPGKREQGQYAMQVTKQVLPFYSDYFGVPYALPKLDQLAVLSVRGGAMEDWGLISYAEDALLVDPERSSPATRRDVYSVVAHEIAHQWFGNLVTAASWEEIWLNEAFATWLETKTTDKFNPDWKIPLQLRRSIDRAMAIDAGSATRAIRSGPVRETAVSDVFDPITYAKGGAVLTMLEQWSGPLLFQRGLVAYMKGQRLSNATAADLWFYIGRASAKDAAAMAASWTDQPGFPLVRADSRCRSGRQMLKLSQSRFSNTGSSESTQLWKIPVSLRQGSQLRTVLLDRADGSFDIGACSDEPVIANSGGTGFYRVLYEPQVLDRLVARFVKLPETERMALLSDSFALMQAGSSSMQSYLSVLSSLPLVADSSRTMLWAVAQSQLAYLDKALAGMPAQSQLHKIARRLLAPELSKLGWTPTTGEDEQTSELRGTLIDLLARFGHRETIAEATRQFDEDDAGRSRLPASLRAPVTLAVGLYPDQPHFERLVARLKAAASEEERWQLAEAIAAGREPQRIAAVLSLARAGVAPANVASAIPGLVAAMSPFGAEAYRYTLDNWPALAELAGTWGRAFLLPKAASAFNDTEHATRLIEDQKRFAGADGDSTARQEADRIRLRAAVRSRETGSLVEAAARTLAD